VPIYSLDDKEFYSYIWGKTLPGMIYNGMNEGIEFFSDLENNKKNLYDDLYWSMSPKDLYMLENYMGKFGLEGVSSNNPYANATVKEPVFTYKVRLADNTLTNFPVYIFNNNKIYFSDAVAFSSYPAVLNSDNSDNTTYADNVYIYPFVFDENGVPNLFMAGSGSATSNLAIFGRTAFNSSYGGYQIVTNIYNPYVIPSAYLFYGLDELKILNTSAFNSSTSAISKVANGKRLMNFLTHNIKSVSEFYALKQYGIEDVHYFVLNAEQIIALGYNFTSAKDVCNGIFNSIQVYSETPEIGGVPTSYTRPITDKIYADNLPADTKIIVNNAGNTYINYNNNYYNLGDYMNGDLNPVEPEFPPPTESEIPENPSNPDFDISGLSEIIQSGFDELFRYLDKMLLFETMFELINLWLSDVPTADDFSKMITELFYVDKNYFNKFNELDELFYEKFNGFYELNNFLKIFYTDLTAIGNNENPPEITFEYSGETVKVLDFTAVSPYIGVVRGFIIVVSYVLFARRSIKKIIKISGGGNA
jgi:hypothetical protein